MARYIDADKMREYWLENGENEYVYDTNAVLDSIDAQPTADVVEAKHGKWKWFAPDSNTRTYSNCRISQTVNVYNDTVMFRYCPYCGAKMDGGDKA